MTPAVRVALAALPKVGPPTVTGIPLHTSAMDIPIPIFWGKRRLTPNVIWMSTRSAGHTISVPSDNPHGGGFPSTVNISNSVTLAHGFESASGDQGGYLKGVVVVQNSAIDRGNKAVYPYDGGWSWFVPMILALCEGPIDHVVAFWRGSSAKTACPSNDDLSALETFYRVVSGSSSQTSAAFKFWSALYSSVPAEALAYRSIAYVGSYFADCGQSGDAPQPPQISFECTRTLGGGYVNSAGDYSLADIIIDLLTGSQYGMGLVIGDIDTVSLLLLRNYTQANLLYYSPLLTGQTKCVDILDRWATLCNCWIFWDGTAMRFVPLGDETVTSGPWTFTPDLTPAYALTLDDFLDASKPVEVTRADPVDCYNRVNLQFSDRANDYASNPVEFKDQGLIDQYGVRDASSIQGDDICNLAVAQIAVNLIGKRMAYIRNTYAFKLSYRFIRILPGTVLSLTEPNIGLNGALVRVRSVEEDENGSLSFLAEEIPGTTGIATPQGSQATSSGVDHNVAPGDINTPAIIEPSAEQTLGIPIVELAASGGANWGGCQVWFSTDGVAYQMAGIIPGPSPQGTLTAGLASHADPDTSDTLSVDFTVSRAVLSDNLAHSDADAGRTVSVIAEPPTLSAGVYTMPNTWELVSYGAVASTGTYTDDLTYLRRGQYGSLLSSHSSGDDFTRLGPNILVWPLPSQYVGQAILFKFLSFNLFGRSQQQLPDVPAYAYTPVGAGFAGSVAGVSGPAWVNVGTGTSVTPTAVQRFFVFNCSGPQSTFTFPPPLGDGDEVGVLIDPAHAAGTPLLLQAPGVYYFSDPQNEGRPVTTGSMSGRGTYQRWKYRASDKTWLLYG